MSLAIGDVIESVQSFVIPLTYVAVLSYLIGMSKKPHTVAQFFKQFPDDEACLNHLFEIRFGQGFTCASCDRPSKWFRIKAERAYSCQFCGHHLHPTAGTPFEQTRTPLQMWFYAIFLFTTARNGVAAKELQRQLGVTYKTAWRMAHLIREHMADVHGEGPLGAPFKSEPAKAHHYRRAHSRVGQACLEICEGNRVPL